MNDVPQARGAIIQDGTPNPEYIGGLFAGFMESFLKNVPIDDLVKGGQAKIVDTKAPKDGLTSVMLDPWEILGYQGARIKHTTLTFEMLRELARAVKPVGAIIKTRQNQVARFCRPPRFRGDIGFSIHLRDRDRKPSESDRKRMLEVEKFLTQMGAGPGVDPKAGKRPGFEKALRMMIRDSLTLDAIALEPRRNLKGELYDFWPVDAATIRFAGHNYERKLADSTTDEPITYLQEYNGSILAEYGSSELIYEIRNPRTDILSNGYGESELELLMETMTALLNADQYNSRYFTQNSLPEGILSIVGQMGQAQLEAFKRAWQAQTSGVVNAWRVPIINTTEGKGVTFTPFKLSNREMMFAEYQDFLINMTCAIYQIDREEIGLSSQSRGDAGGLGNAGSNQSTLDHSKSKGFYPLMTFLENVINEHIIWALDDEFRFSWEGIDPDQEAAQWAMWKEKLQAGVATPRQYWTAMDIKDDYPSHMWPDCPPNAQLQSIFLQESGLLDQNQMQSQGDEVDDAVTGDDDDDGGEE